MNLNLVTLAQVKEQLGITDSISDAKITAMIPIVSSDVRRILNYDFSEVKGASITNGSNVLVTDKIKLGQVVSHAGIIEGTYINAYDPITGRYTMSASATTDGNFVSLGITIGMLPTISKMIQYRLSKQNNKNEGESLSSISYGSVSKSYSQKEINRQYNYPQILIDDLGIPYASVC